jgi:hypothetical protein
VKLEESFAKALGRPPSEAERERLYRLRDALDLQDNDALWTVVMALEHYDALYRVYPTRLAEETAQAIESARSAFQAAAAAEAIKVQASLAAQVAKASVELARKMARKPVGLPWLAGGVASVVLFGGICVAAGAALQVGRPFWLQPRGELHGGLLRVLGAVLAAPAGWMVFLGLVPAAWHGGRLGWQMALSEGSRPTERVLGWMLVTGSALGALGCVGLLVEVL